MKKELKFKDLKHGDRTIVVLPNGQVRKAKVIVGYCDECPIHRKDISGENDINKYIVAEKNTSYNPFTLAGCGDCPLTMRFEVNCKARRMIARFNRRKFNK